MALVLGVNGWHSGGHDAAAALVSADDETCTVLAAVEEEKVTGDKHAYDTVPSASVQEVLSIADVRATEIDAIVYGWDIPAAYADDGVPFCLQSTTDSGEIAAELGIPEAAKADLRFVPHHLAHASSAFRTAGWSFANAPTLVADGCGENESLTVWKPGRDGRLTCVLSRGWRPSLGFMFEAANVMLGFRTSDSGKTMGLAGYGTPSYATELLTAVGLDGQGSSSFLALCERVERFYGRKHGVLRRKQTVSVGAWLDVFERQIGLSRANEPVASFHEASRLERDLAASVQYTLERIVANVLGEALGDGDIPSLCVAGGVGLNCAMNGALASSFGITQMFVHPAANDAGCAIGAALEYCHQEGRPWMVESFSPYLGREYDDGEIVSMLDDLGLAFDERPNAADQVAEMVAEGRVLGVFQGRNEWGPRALGARSILAKPVAGMLDWINAHVKYREPGRPLGPSLLPEDQQLLWDRPENAGSHMTIARIATGGRERFPATIHVDGTFRPQVLGGQLPEYTEQLRSVRARIGSSIVVNTSFNGRGPIVYKPRAALSMLEDGRLDAVVFNNRITVRHHDPHHRRHY